MKRTVQWLRILTILLVITPIQAAYAVGPTAEANFPLLIQVNSGIQIDTIRFADHTNSPMEGNWIILGGGTDADLPQITMKYTGVIEETTYTRGSNQIYIDTYNLEGRSVEYPFSTHQTYTLTQTVTYTFRGDAGLVGVDPVSVRVIPVTATSFRDAASDAFLGDTTALKSLISIANSVYHHDEILDVSGDLVSKTISTSLPAGDYVLFIVKETPGNPYSLDVYSATAIEVLDYTSTVTVPSSVTRGSDLSIQVQLSGADSTNRRYGAVIIQQSKYSVDLELTSDGTTEGTSLKGRGATLIKGTADSFSLAGITLDGLDKDQLIDKLNEAYSGAEFSTGFTDYTTATSKTVQVTTTGLNTGKFVVLVGVWEGASDKLVAFHQSEVTVSEPPAEPGPAPGPSLPSTLAQLQAMSNAEAAAALSDMSPSIAAGLMNQITAEKAAGIFGKMTTSNAAAIINQMQTGAATAAMNKSESSVVVRILAAADPAKAVGILGEMDVGSVARAFEEAVDVGKATQFSGYMNMLDENRAAEILLETAAESGARIVEGMAQDNMLEAAKRVEAAVKLRLGETDPAKAQQLLNRIAATLDNTDTDTLVDIFIEIANLPETPSTVATVLEAMETAKVLDVVSTWVVTGSLDELAEVFSYFSDGFLSEVWGGMSAAERSALFTHLAPETVQRLPEVGEFQLSALHASPATVAPGQGVTISVAVENVGQDPGVYTLVLKIDGATEQTQKVVMSPGEQQTVQWTVTRTEAKTYSVGVNELAGSFTVQTAPTPAAFTLSNLAVSPSTVEPGATVTIAVAVQNTGGERGSTLVELKINGVTENTETVTLNVGASDTVTFTVSRSTEATYAVSIGSLTGGFTVVAPEAPPPSVPWAAILGAVVIVAGVGYYIYNQRRTLKSP